MLLNASFRDYAYDIKIVNFGKLTTGHQLWGSVDQPDDYKDHHKVGMLLDQR